MASRIRLRRVTLADERKFLESVHASRALHRPWIQAPSTPQRFRAYVRRLRRPDHRGFLICARSSGALVGVMNISNIVLGNFHSAYLAYYAFAGFQRQGLMAEGLRAVVLA